MPELADRYDALARARDPYLDRAQRVALVTEPLLYPPDGFGPTSQAQDPFQSAGAQGVETLSAKLSLALFPPGVPFFRLVLSPASQRLLDAQDEDQANDVASALHARTLAVLAGLEQPTFRVRIMELLRHVVVGGNGLLQLVPRTTRFRFFPLHSFVLQRDNADNLLEVGLRESVDPRTLPDSARSLVDPGRDEHVLLTFYTRVDASTFRMAQELDGKAVPGAVATFPEELLPVVPVRWEAASGESYGRGFAEKMLGDLTTLESLTEAMVNIAAEASRIVPLVDPSGVTDLEDVMSAQQGEGKYGRASDVGYLRLDKAPDLQTAIALMQESRKEIRGAFFQGSSVQRAGERVTATEIAFLQSELDNALGGGFSALAEELQAPVLRLVVAAMERTQQLAPLPKGVVVAKIVTGLDGLGRARELQSLQGFMGSIAGLPPDVLRAAVDLHGYVSRVARLSGLDERGLVHTKQQFDAAVQAQQAAALAAQVAPKVAGQLLPQANAR